MRTRFILARTLLLAGGIYFALALSVTVSSALADESLTELEMVGRYQQMEKEAERRLASGRRTTAVVAPLCIAYAKIKRYDRLFACLDTLERLVNSGDRTIETDKALISNSDAAPLAHLLRSEALIELGDYAKAAAEARSALAGTEDRLPYGIWPPIRYRLSALSALALAHALQGDRKNAVVDLRALEEVRIGFMGSAVLNPLKANAIARVNMALRDYAAVRKHMDAEEGSWTRTVWFMNNAAWGFSGSDAAETFIVLPKLLMRGISSYETGDPGGAKAVLSAMLRHERISDFGELHWLALYYLGRISESENKIDDAINSYTGAIRIIERQRASINTEANKIGFVGDKQAVYARLVSVLIARGETGVAFDFVERAKSRALVDMLATKKDFAAQGADPERARLVLAQLESAESAFRVQAPDAQPGVGDGARGLYLARQQIQQIAPELSTLVTVNSVPPTELQGLIGDGETLVEYYYQDRECYVFIVARDRLQAVKLDANGLAEEVLRLRRSLERPESNAWQAAAQRIYARLWQPVDDLIKGSNVIIVPHGALHYLPFGVLQAPDGSFLLDRYGIRLLPSASVLKFVRPSPQKTDTPLLVLGNPDLGDPKTDLKFAEEEARYVAGMFTGARVLTRGNASETNFKKAGALFSRLHFATHGKFHADSPLSSGLYLARDGENDGILTVGELYSMGLDADLVTLSACETGLGKITNGDDIVGLTRGFLYAGSRSIVASLWSVDDKATAELMKAFYEKLAGMNKAEALRQAQLKTRQSFPHPFFWAAFQLTGRAE